MNANMDFCLAAQLAMMQRQLWEAEAERQRQEARHRMQAAMFQVGRSVYAEAERMPLYAMFNPDPRAYDIARKAANEVQAAALDFMSKQLDCGAQSKLRSGPEV